MLKLRLKRYGRKGKPSYRIVVMDSKSKRDGEAIEELGYYNPISKEVNLNNSRIQERLKQGVYPTPIVKRLINNAQITS
nr:ribosomal protein S16 [Cavernulicola chilensis]